jgi:hypothetical protein
LSEHGLKTEKIKIWNGEYLHDKRLLFSRIGTANRQ